METSYTPVQYVYREIIEEEIGKKTQGKIFYFDNDNLVCSAEGVVLSMEEVNDQGIFITMDPRQRIRIDRIITLFGKPGAAYDEYEAYGNVCLDCTGGYPVD